MDAAWTKNRKSGFQPLPRSLVEQLHVFAESGEPAQLYAHFYRRKDATLKAPKRPLLYVPSDPSRELGRILEAAGIPKDGPGGKIDFHGLRLAYINFVLESGVSVKEAQALARHATPDITMNIYGRTREDRLAKAVEEVASAVLPEEKRAICVQRQAVGAETENATPFENIELRSEKMVELRGIEPLTS